ncbi:MAG: NAD(P)/FAD-dependent oxidoreductase [Anaerolineales bacterium]|nr:NAD(P)/FAD-dependent oxidoreductase [Anaerolineales bacterium]
MQKQIIVIGGGPAGIEAAKAAATAGARVILVSNAPIGGRAGWHSLLPSKVWLTASDSLALFLEAERLGVAADTAVQPDLPQILARIAHVKQTWNGQQASELEALGVEVMVGTAVFTSSTTIALQDDQGQTGQTLTADAFIVAAGSVPVFPPHMKPNGKQIIAPRFASALNTLPPHMIVVGGGATGTEFAYLFNRLGVAVTWIVDETGVLPTFDPQAAQFVAEALTGCGVTLLAGQQVAQLAAAAEGVTAVLADGTTHTADMAFLAIGRRPDVAGLNLAAAELGDVVVDEYGRSAQPHIYFVGDVTGAPMIANRAMAQAWTAGRHAAGQTPIVCSPQTVIRAIYTEPQLAEVGRLTGADLDTVQVPFAASLKAHLLPHQEGFVKLAYERGNGRIAGAVAVGPHAGDVIAPVAVALQAELTVAALGALYGAHPTLSELAFMAARQGHIES